MKKGWIVALAAIVALYAATAWLLGYSIERRSEEFVQRFNESTPYVKISTSRFHRGWFTSDQELTLQAAQPVLGSLQLTVHNVIRHGPICAMTCLGLAQIDSHLVFGPQLQPYLTMVFGTAEPLSIRSRLGLFGGGSAQVSSPPISDAPLAGGHFSSEGLNAKVEYAANLDYTVQVSAPHLFFAGKDGTRFDVSGISADLKAKRALRTLYAGDTTIAIAQLSFGDAAASGTFKASDLKINSHTALVDGFVSSTVKYGVGGLTSALVTLTGVNFDLTFRHLDAESLEHLTAAMREMNRDTTMAPQARLRQMMDVAKPHVIALFSKQPEVSIDRISASTTAGSALMSGLITFHSLGSEDFDNAAGTKALLQKIDANIDVSVDEAFLTSLPGGSASSGRLQPLVSQGFATLEGGKFHTQVGFHAGQTTFNGKPFTAPVAAPQ